MSRRTSQKFKEFRWKINCIRFASRDKDRWILEYTNCSCALLEIKVEHFKLQLASELMFISNGRTLGSAAMCVSINGIHKECSRQKNGNCNRCELMDCINEKLTSVLGKI